MLVCGHEREAFGKPMCVHLRECRSPRMKYGQRYTGSGMDAELLCDSCLNERQIGGAVTTDVVCRECFEYATTEVGQLTGVHGKPEIRVRPEPFNVRLRKTDLPVEFGKVIDIAPANRERGSIWLLLADDGRLARFNADTGAYRRLGDIRLRPEPEHEPWCGHSLRHHLYASAGADFAAVVNDFGRYGQVVDLRSGRATLELDGGDYHPETVPFSFAFAEAHGRPVAVHRTAWNRLDVSDPATGALLTARGPTSYRRGEERPAHYLDYFHGGLSVSPNDVRIADDGWVWHPVGVPVTWRLDRWIADNVWESEDGPTRMDVCARDYWNQALAWLDDDRLAIGGIGDDDNTRIDGVRIFDVSQPGSADTHSRKDWPWPREVTAFAGPAGSFFSDGKWLFSSDPGGLSRWDVSDGSRTGHLPGFNPAYHHRGAGELVQLVDGALVRLSIGPS